MKRIVCDLPADEHKQIKLAAVERGVQISDVVRQLLALWLAGKVKLPKAK